MHVVAYEANFEKKSAGPAVKVLLSSVLAQNQEPTLTETLDRWFYKSAYIHFQNFFQANLHLLSY